MPTPEELEVAELLLGKAASDLSAARVLADDVNQHDDVVGFHAQQAIEKSLKAVLAVRGFEIPRTHDLDLLTHWPPGDGWRFAFQFSAGWAGDELADGAECYGFINSDGRGAFLWQCH